MATTVVTPQPSGITLSTVISELQFILQLKKDAPKDPRLPQLLTDAQNDLAKAAQAIIKGGTDPLLDPVPPPPTT